MGIQDDIFDVQDALKDRPELEQFENIHSYIGELESELELYRKFYVSAVELQIAIKNLEKLNSAK